MQTLKWYKNLIREDVKEGKNPNYTLTIFEQDVSMFIEECGYKPGIKILIGGISINELRKEKGNINEKNLQKIEKYLRWYDILKKYIKKIYN